MHWRMPIQALTLRTKDQIEQQNNPPGSVHAAAPAPKEVASKGKKEDDVQGVFVIRNQKGEFRPGDHWNHRHYRY